MPWEHAFVGYVSYSLFVHAVYRASPTSASTIVVGVGSLFPDLVDKPLAWELGIFPSGYGIAHSVFFALPVSVATGWFAWSRGRPRLGIAFTVGYLLHLMADLGSKFLLDGELQLARVLWPIRQAGSGYDTGFVGELTGNIVGYVRWMSSEMVSANPDPYFLLLLGIWLLGMAVWLYDGMPVARDLFDAVRRVVRDIARAARSSRR
ncbi:metal-dependent hydrolase [Haloarcula marina]|uniref:metal-dependent hydrolase n=1 Tax=Haloarcula marina TaxID=2961574 RepID=UPI0020B77E5E|nr:metal-dependent hydrolase [Halomicroarcula marina]